LTHYAAPSFWRCYEALPGEPVRTLADKQFQLLKTAPAIRRLISNVLVDFILRASGRTTEYLFMRADGEQLKGITRLVESGAIKPLVDKVFPLEHVRDALAYAESGRATGKVVIKVA
jgi:zinc-binding alcohol dehydrogenase family protein